jgi:four helix bundle protein
MGNVLRHDACLRTGMNERALAFEERTMVFALRATELCHTLCRSWQGRHVADQLFRSSTGMAAAYRAARRGRSHREFTAKLGIALEEADESVFWLLFTQRSKLNDSETVKNLSAEANELLAVIAASVRTASTRDQNVQKGQRRSPP